MNAEDKRSLSAIDLAQLVGVGSPDSPDSPGAKFLELIRDSFEPGMSHDAIVEVADGCVPTYTHEKWKTFVELRAYEIDTREITGTSTSMNDRAGVALFLIAEQLLTALAEKEENA